MEKDEQRKTKNAEEIRRRKKIKSEKNKVIRIRDINKDLERRKRAK